MTVPPGPSGTTAPDRGSETRPLLAFAPPSEGLIPPDLTRRMFPRPRGPGGARQGQRLSPQFEALHQAISAGRAEATETATEPDPEMVLVFDLAGTVAHFARAVTGVPGLEFLAELDEGRTDADEDFQTVAPDGRVTGQLNEMFYLVMTNAAAAGQLVSLFQRWQADEETIFDRGLAPLRDAFKLLRAIRRWGPQDRVRETGLLEQWRSTVDFMSGTASVARVEVELWFRYDPARRAAAQGRAEQLVGAAGGTVITSAQLPDIGYHALLVDLPYEQVELVLAQGPEAVELLRADGVMIVSPARPMTIPRVTELAAGTAPAQGAALPTGLPVVALLDGVPLANHNVLAGRLALDDPDGLGGVTVSARQQHGTAMASLIVHGDLAAPGPPLSSPLYVRPILGAHPFADAECVPADELLVDLIHRSFNRIFQGDGPRTATADSVRIVNLSIGDPQRAYVRRLSPLAKLLDWLAYEYNLLILVSAGNHDTTTTITADALTDPGELTRQVLASAQDEALRHRLLSPAEAVNVLTIGATHTDAWTGQLPDTVLDALDAGLPASYGAVGSGHRRSVKPDILAPGGRSLFQRPLTGAGDVDLLPAGTTATGPGLLVAAPDPQGTAGATAHTHGTSNATALATRAAAQVMHQLTELQPGDAGYPFPDAQYHPVLTKALLVHAASWGPTRSVLERHAATELTPRGLSQLLGYGPLDMTRLAAAARNRATLLGAGTITADERRQFRFPLPVGLRSVTDRRRLVMTLAWISPVAPLTQRHRSARLWFQPPHETLRLTRTDTDWTQVRQGTVQHELLEGAQAVVFDAGADLVIDVDCRFDTGKKPFPPVRYALVVSLEVALNVQTDIHAQVQQRLRAAREQARVRPTSS